MRVLPLVLLLTVSGGAQSPWLSASRSTAFASPTTGAPALSWGDNDLGHCGNGSFARTVYPQPVNGGPWAQIVGGLDHSIGRDSAGNVFAWGRSTGGVLGTGGFSPALPVVLYPTTSTPTAVAGPTGAIDVAASRRASYAIDGTGRLWGWGNSSSGMLPGLTGFIDPPVQLPFTNAVDVESGEVASFVQDDQGDVWFFGSAAALGDPPGLLPPTRLDALQGIEQLSTRLHTAALRNGTVYTFGPSAASGQLGPSAVIGAVGIPSFREVPGLPPIAEVAVGRQHSMALDVNGNVWVWGDNTVGQLGLRDRVSRTVPEQVPGLGNIVAIAAAAFASFALESDGTIWAVGSNGGDLLGGGPEGAVATVWLPTASGPPFASVVSTPPPVPGWLSVLTTESAPRIGGLVVMEIAGSYVSAGSAWMFMVAAPITVGPSYAFCGANFLDPAAIPAAVAAGVFPLPPIPLNPPALPPASWEIDLPDDPALAGAVLTCQAIYTPVPVPFAPPLGPLTCTEALEFTIQ